VSPVRGSVMASDAFFPFADGLEAGIEAGITAVIQPGGSRRDDEVIAAADKAGIAMVFTGSAPLPALELRKLADIVLDMGVIEEPCPLGLTPSASMAVMSAIGDALALTLMDEKKVTRRDYGLRHHGGYLGHKARLQNEDKVTTPEAVLPDQGAGRTRTD
jgi:hypothetical protein